MTGTHAVSTNATYYIGVGQLVEILSYYEITYQGASVAINVICRAY